MTTGIFAPTRGGGSDGIVNNPFQEYDCNLQALFFDIL